MTTEIDSEGLAAAAEAVAKYNGYTFTAARVIATEAIAAYLATTRTSEAEPVALEAAAEDLPTFLLWVAESYEAHAKVSEHLDEIDGYIGSANMARAHLAKLTLPTPASDDQAEAVLGEVQFLLDRLNDFENVLYDDHEAVRDWSGNVAPAVSRTSKALAAMGSTKPAPRLDATVRGEEG